MNDKKIRGPKETEQKYKCLHGKVSTDEGNGCQGMDMHADLQTQAEAM